jgi:DNA-binding NarL/FixJ family response regulator
VCVRVFLADDADVMRRAIQRFLSNREDISVVGEASTFYETTLTCSHGPIFSCFLSVTSPSVALQELSKQTLMPH